MEQYNEIKITYNNINHRCCRRISCRMVFLWYVPHTPAYTLKIIHQAVQEKNADEVLRHVDVKSIVKNIVDREGNKYIDTSNPFGKAP